MKEDEFQIIHCTIIGSEDLTNEDNYNLVFSRINTDNDGLTFAEIVRLKDFLSKYIASKKGGKQ